MQVILRLIFITFLLAIVGPATLLADEDAKQLISQAYKATKSTESIDDYTSVIDLCQQAQAYKLSEANSKYVKQLLAWALNRRGEALVDQAATLVAAGEPDRAAELDGKALADFEAAVRSDDTRWKAIHNRGVSRALAGNYEEAVEDFSQVVTIKADYVNAWFNRGEIQYELGKFEEAIADYSQALELAPGDFGAYTSRGHSYFQMRKYDAALNDYSSAIDAAPKNAAAHANRGDAHRCLQHWEECAKDFRKAIELNPSSPRGYQGAAWLMVTCPDDRIRNAKLGLQAATKATELASEEDYQILDTLAAAYANAGQFEDAVATISKAIAVAPQTVTPVLTQRLELYSAETPYRETLARTAQAASGTQTE